MAMVNNCVRGWVEDKGMGVVVGEGERTGGRQQAGMAVVGVCGWGWCVGV